MNKTQLNHDQFAKICKAMAHPVRVKIICYLKEQDRCICGKIADIFPLAQSTVSQHLKHLKEAGLIKGIVEGPAVCYCLDHDLINKFKNMVREF